MAEETGDEATFDVDALFNVDEPSFDIDALINETDHENTNYGAMINELLQDHPMETPSPVMPSSELVQQNEPTGTKGSHQVGMPTSDAEFSMSMNPDNTSGHGSIGGQSNYPVGERLPNTPFSTVPELNQHQLLHHHSSAQFVERPNNYAHPALLNAYEREQQQISLRNLSPSGSQESLSGNAQQQSLQMEMQRVSRQRQMEKALFMQTQFPQTQNVRFAHPMKSRNDQHHFLQGPPQSSSFQAPWDSTPQVKMPNSSDWVGHAIQEVQYLKDMYLPEVVLLYNTANELRKQTQSPKMEAACENSMDISVRTHKFLHMSRIDIFCDGKDTFSRGMSCLRQSLDRIREMNLRLRQYAASSFSQLKTPQLQQRGVVPEFFSTSPSSVQRGLSSVNSLQVGSSSGIKNYASSSPRNSLQIDYGQRFSNMPPNFSTGVPQQMYMSDLQKVVASSPNVYNSDSSICPIARNSLMRNPETNNGSNVMKSTEQLMSERHMQQIMQKSNGNSAMRHFMTFNRSSSYEVPSSQSSSLTDLSEFKTSSLSPSKRTSPSTLNPMTPSSKRVDSEKSLLSVEEGSPAQPELQLKGSNQSNSVLDSEKLQNCPLEDVAKMEDRTSGSFLHEEPTMDIDNDTRKCKDQENFKLVHGTGVGAEMKRQMDSSQLRTGTEDCESDMIKRPRKQNNSQLLQEISEIKQKFAEVDVDAKSGHDEGIFIIRCSYSPIELQGNNNLANTLLQKFPVLEFTVTSDYPHSSPIVVETEPNCSSLSEEGKEMWRNLMSNFKSALGKYPQPVSLTEMAKTWESCAREVYRQFAQRNGGGAFSSKHGGWTCVAS